MPLILILMAVIELWVARGPWLWAIGATLVVARICQATGMSLPAPNPFRIAGTATTFIVLIGTSIWAVLLGLGS